MNRLAHFFYFIIFISCSLQAIENPNNKVCTKTIQYKVLFKSQPIGNITSITKSSLNNIFTNDTSFTYKIIGLSNKITSHTQYRKLDKQYIPLSNHIKSNGLWNTDIETKFSKKAKEATVRFKNKSQLYRTKDNHFTDLITTINQIAIDLNSDNKDLTYYVPSDKGVLVYKFKRIKIKQQNKNELTILLASHNMKEVERLCNKIIMMKQGKIVDEGTCGELISKHGRKNLEETFLKIARSKK